MINPFYPIPFPAFRGPRLKVLNIYELPTANVSLSATSVDYGIDKCIYNQLPCECYITLQINSAVPAGGAALPVTIVAPTGGNTTNTGSSTANSGEKRVNVVDHNSSNVIGSDLTGTREVFAYLNKRDNIIRFVNFQTGGTAPTGGDTPAPASAAVKSAKA
jgi:hypothetical protein